MTTRVDQAHVGDGVVVGDGVLALAVRARWAVASAGGARCKLRVRSNLRVANDLRLVACVERRRNVVLARVRLGGPVDTRQVDLPSPTLITMHD